MIGTDPLVLVVAHPDDEILFFSEVAHRAHIICITNGDDAIRSAEFEASVALLRTTGEIWTYPDRKEGWAPEEKDSIASALLTAVADQQVITHNAAGEYGHRQHQELHSLLHHLDPVCPSLGGIEEHALAHRLSLFRASYPSQQGVLENKRMRRWIMAAHVSVPTK